MEADTSAPLRVDFAAPQPPLGGEREEVPPPLFALGPAVARPSRAAAAASPPLHSPAATPLPPSAVLSARTGLQCEVSVGGQRSERLLFLPSPHSSPTRPFLLPFARLWTRPQRRGGAGSRSLHLRLELPDPSSPSAVRRVAVDVFGLWLDERWKAAEERREALDALYAPPPSPLSFAPPRIRVRAQLDEEQPTLAPSDGDGKGGGGGVRAALGGLRVALGEATDSPAVNWSEVRLRWSPSPASPHGRPSPALFDLRIRPLLLRSAELNARTGEVAVAELHWSDAGDVRRGVKRPMEEEGEDDSSDDPAPPTPPSLSPAACQALLRGGGEASSASSSGGDSSDSDDEPQMASTSPSAPLSFPFLADADYVHSVRLEALLLFHYRELRAFQRGNEWIQCDACSAYRRLPEWVRMDELPSVWVCRMNPNLLLDDCDRKGEEEEMGKRGDWVEDTCAVCEKGDGERCLVGGFGGWRRREEGGKKAKALAPSAALLHSSGAASRAASPPVKGGAAAVPPFPLLSAAPARSPRPLIGCAGPCCRSFHVECAGLTGPFSAPTHRHVDREWYCLSEDMEVLTDRGFMSRAEVFAACPELTASMDPAPMESHDALPFDGAVTTAPSLPAALMCWTPSPAEKEADAAAGIRHEQLKAYGGGHAPMQLRDSLGRYGRQCGGCGARVWSSTQKNASQALTRHIRVQHVEEVHSARPAERRASLSTASTASVDVSTDEELRLSQVVCSECDSGEDGEPMLLSSARCAARCRQATGLLTSATADEDANMDDEGFAIPPPVSRPPLARPASMPVGHVAVATSPRPKRPADLEWTEPRPPLRRLRRMSAPAGSLADAQPAFAAVDDFTFTPRGRSLSAASVDSLREACKVPAPAASPLRFASLDPSTGHLVYAPATALVVKTSHLAGGVHERG